MRRARRRHDDFADALANFALTFAKLMLVFSVILMVMLNPEARKTEDGLKPKIEYMVSAEWPEGNHDVDLWLQTPTGQIIYYGNREAAFVALERDDLGTTGDTSVVNGQQITHAVNEEAISVRSIVPGEYIVNVHLFRGNGNTAGTIPPLPVKVKVQKFNPKLETVSESSLTLATIRQEAHALRFTVRPDGTVGAVTTGLPVLLRDKPRGFN